MNNLSLTSTFKISKKIIFKKTVKDQPRSLKRLHKRKGPSVNSRKHSHESKISKTQSKNVRTQVCSPIPIGSNCIFLKIKKKSRNPKVKKKIPKINFLKTTTFTMNDGLRVVSKKPIIQMKPKAKPNKKLSDRIKKLESTLL